MILQDVIPYRADGLAMRGTLYRDDAVAGPKPGILVYPEGGGLGPHIHERAERLAREGYAALACDLHGDALVVEGMDQVLALLTPLLDDAVRTRARARGALDALRARPDVDPSRIAAIGFCFGGTMALELARAGAPILAAVGFHSGLTTAAPALPGVVGAKILVCLGADDPGIPVEQRHAFQQEMTAAGADWRMHVYGGVVHSFTNPAADAIGNPAFARYDADADRRSWREMLALLADLFG